MPKQQQQAVTSISALSIWFERPQQLQLQYAKSAHRFDQPCGRLMKADSMPAGWAIWRDSAMTSAACGKCAIEQVRTLLYQG